MTQTVVTGGSELKFKVLVLNGGDERIGDFIIQAEESGGETTALELCIRGSEGTDQFRQLQGIDGD